MVKKSSSHSIERSLHMKATRIGNQRFTSASKAAVHLAKTTDLTNTQIAKKVNMRPQTVGAAIRREMLSNITPGVKPTSIY